jgi:hypothetical protein
MGNDRDVATDPTLFAARLRDYELSLFRGIMLSRAGIVLGLGLILPDERTVHGHVVFRMIVIAWAAALLWAAVPLVRIRPLFVRLRAHPELVWLDVAVLAALLGVGGGWRNPFYLYAWSPLGLASVMWSARRTAVLVGIACGLQLASFAVWHAGGWDPAARQVHAAEWASPLLGYVIVGGLFAYVRRRFDDLADAADAYARRAREAISAMGAAAVAAEAEEVAYRLHRRLRQVFPALGLRLAALEDEAPHDRVAADIAALSLVTRRADAALDEVIARLRAAGEDGTAAASTFGTGRGERGFVG